MRRRRAAGAAASLAILATLFGAPTGALQPAMHEPRRCAMRGTCGSENTWSPQLPCADNGPAAAPDAELRAALVDVCGEAWAQREEVCCAVEQVRALLVILGCWVADRDRLRS